ncbi:MAG TPA: cellulose synthase operon protein YhjQ/BcsQ [Candidatus Binataceae bacterium]|nr:cellulose synthase operon protein YhjQ/BcsQ [Candidatus Binataceae bacterium]
MNSAQHNGNRLKSVRHRRPSSLNVSLAGGLPAQRLALRESLAALTGLRIEVTEIWAPGQAPPRNDAVRILMILLDEDPDLWEEELRPWIASRNWSQVTAVVTKRTPETVRGALSAGANEVLFMPFDPVDLARSLWTISETAHDGGGQASKAAYALVSVSGGVGVSSLTVALGLALRRLTQKQVALVDLGLQSASLSAILDLENVHSIGELADPTTSVDSIRLESATSKHASGLYLLSAPARIEDGEMVSPGTIEATVGVMLQLFDYVLIDCGHQVNEGSVAAWERAGNVLYVLDQSITSVRAAQRFLDLFDRLKLRHVTLDLLVNHYRPSHSVSLEKIEAALHRPVAFCVPHDQAALAAAEAQGDGLTSLAAGSPMLLAVEELAESLIGAPPSTNGARKPGVFSKLMTAMGH